MSGRFRLASIQVMSASTQTAASGMAAIMVTEHGASPLLAELPLPQPRTGEALIKVTAAALNKVDLALASGRFFAPMPPPYVPGVEGCGMVVRSEAFAPGTRVRFYPRLPHGSLSAFSIARDDDLITVPEGAPDDLVAALGMVGWVAWLSLRVHGRLAAGERVLVLGATGSVGQLAVQLAKLWGAASVVGVGRDRAVLDELSRLGADSVVALDAQTADELAAAFTEAAGGPIQVILDGFWGEPALAALKAAAPGARLINFGDNAAPAMSVPTALLRGKGISLIAHNSLFAAPGLLREAFEELLGLALSGELKVARELVSPDRIGEAWQAVGASAHRKLVVEFPEAAP